MSREEYEDIIKQLRELAAKLHQSDSGVDWSKAFSLEDMAKELEAEINAPPVTMTAPRSSRSR